MTDDEAKAELLRRQALADAAEARAQLEADRPAREARSDEAMVERWRARQAPRPVRRAPEPPQRQPSPPIPSKVPLHDKDGRIVAIFDGDGASSAKSWQAYIANTVAAAVAAERRAASAQLGDALEALAAEAGREIGRLARRIEALEASQAPNVRELPHAAD